MDPSYETVVPVMDLVWTLFAYLIHGASVFVQVGLASFLLGTGASGLVSPDRAGPWLRRLGVVSRMRTLAALRIALGLLLFAPLALGAPTALSLVACVGALALLLFVERGLQEAERPPGRFTRRGAIGLAAFCAAFMVWEGEDSLTLAADLLLPGMEWRNEELRWQLGQDPLSPKVGDLAPDFELKDPEGVTQVRLSDFRGQRPVALVFGSYT